jgi:anti-anti-sigma regulatory factor
MGEHALTVKVVRDGPDRALIVCGDLDFTQTGGFLGPTVLAVGDRPGRLILDLAGVTFLDCAGVRALAVTASSVPSGCPVIIGSLSPAARRILELLDLDVKDSRQPWPGPRPAERTRAGAAGQQEPGPAGAGAPVAAPGGNAGE